MNKENNTFVLSDGRKLGYAEYGDSKGKPIFFFHGWPSSRLQASILDKPAKKLHTRIISMDRAGYGLSTFQKIENFSTGRAMLLFWQIILRSRNLLLLE